MMHGFWQEGGESFWTSAIGRFFSRREREKSFPVGEGRLSPFGRREKVCSSFFLVVWGCFFLSAGKGGFFWSERVGIVGVSCILSSLVFHSGFLSISIPFIIASQAAHVPVGKGSPYGRTGRLLVSFSLPLSSSFFLFILHLLLFLGRVLFVLHSSLPGRCLESRDEGLDPLESWQRNGEGAVDDFALLVEEEPLLGLASHALVGHRVLAPDAPAVEFLFLQ